MNPKIITNFADHVEFDQALAFFLKSFDLVTKLRPNSLMIFLADLLMYVEVAKVDVIRVRETLKLPYQDFSLLKGEVLSTGKRTSRAAAFRLPLVHGLLADMVRILLMKENSLPNLFLINRRYL
jgi:hypothetical protein